MHLNYKERPDNSLTDVLQSILSLNLSDLVYILCLLYLNEPTVNSPQSSYYFQIWGPQIVKALPVILKSCILS